MIILLILATLLTVSTCSSNKEDVADESIGVISPIEPGPDPVPPTPPVVIEPGNSIDGFNTVDLIYSDLDKKTLIFLENNLETQFSPDEFTIVRQASQNYDTEIPSIKLTNKDIFSSYATFYLDLFLFNSKARVETLSPYYAVPSDIDDHMLSGIAHAELCTSTSQSLAFTIKESKVPSQLTIIQLNIFEQKVNSLRDQAIFEFDKEAKVELIQTWAKFMGCLAYTESLTTADTSTSYSVSNEYSPNDYSKPKGVKFYEDPYQDIESRLNIGLYQFTPNSSGNIYPCIDQWNDIFPDSSIGTRESQDELIKLFGSSFQSMNAFCGVNKILQTFSIQVNTTEAKRTHPDNKNDRNLINPENRCVTPWFYASYAYNHFGPLQNSTGSNLSKLIKCVNGE